MTRPFRTLDDLGDLAGRQTLVRVDFNVPMRNGAVGDTTRIDRVLPTLRELAGKGARIALLAHLGRPGGVRVPALSLEPVAAALGEALGRPVRFAPDCIGAAAVGAVAATTGGDVLLLENVRFHPGEEANDPDFARQLAAHGSLYVGDAFSASHRAHASTGALARLLPAYAGRAMEAEMEALERALDKPARPLVAIVGGAKVSTKLDLLTSLAGKVDTLAIGGAMANTFLKARGTGVGRSPVEAGLVATARRIMVDAAARGCVVALPADAVVTDALEAGASGETVGIDAVPAEATIVDAGPRSAAAVNAWIDRSATLVWNGPFGAFEIEPFDAATLAVARHAAARTAAGELVSVAGGGDTVSALNRAGVLGDFSVVSTAGGAFLEWLEGKALPGVEALRQSSDNQGDRLDERTT